MSQQVLIFGAGKIGRSFMAPVFSHLGYSVRFVDADRRLVDLINTNRQYRVTHIAPDGGERTEVIGPVSAIPVHDRAAVTESVLAASVIVTCVGKVALEKVLATIADAFAATTESRKRSVNVVLAENVHHGGDLARRLFDSTGISRSQIGIVETSIGKMVPIIDGMNAESPLDVAAEQFNTLIIDGDGWVGPVPENGDILAVSPIRAYVDRKLYIHNFGHAAAAYLGHLHAPRARYLSELVADPQVRQATREAMTASARSLLSMYPESFTRTALQEHVDDLLARFGNGALRDQVFRVGADLPRKLGADDRVVGTLRIVDRFGTPEDLDLCAEVFAAALRFHAPGPDGTRHRSDREVIEHYQTAGLDSVLRRYSGLDPDSDNDRSICQAIRAADRRLKDREGKRNDGEPGAAAMPPETSGGRA